MFFLNRPYAYLQEELCQGFEGQGNALVIVDRGSGERRAGREPVTVEGRQADQRRAQEIVGW